MNITVSVNNVLIGDIEFFNLDECFDCGQCFRWEKKDCKYHGIVEGRYIIIYWDVDRNNLIVENSNLEDVTNFWCNYFDLQTNYTNIRREFSTLDQNLEKACIFAPGIRILKQNFWETLCSFIISQNNRIPSIRKIIANLCREFGEKISTDIYSFPDAEIIADIAESQLNKTKTGFRTKYIIDAANRVANGEINFDLFASMSIEEVRIALQKINGVGPKIAECVILFSLHKLNAFPLDVWMLRIMNEFYPNKTSAYFGQYAGVAQQYLYHYYRSFKNSRVLN